MLDQPRWPSVLALNMRPTTFWMFRSPPYDNNPHNPDLFSNFNPFKPGTRTFVIPVTIFALNWAMLLFGVASALYRTHNGRSNGAVGATDTEHELSQKVDDGGGGGVGMWRRPASEQHELYSPNSSWATQRPAGGLLWYNERCSSIFNTTRFHEVQQQPP